jgi:radical SAM superfamily enzyme YgiQ (UPF0313 family)
MNIALINAAFNRYGGIQGHGGTMMPLNLCYLAAYARKQHPDAAFKIIDAEIQNLSHKETVDEVQAFSADLIAVTANTCVFDSVLNLIELLKEHLVGVPIVVGGPHPSALPQQTLQESKADFVIIGEGELTFADIIAHLKTGIKEWNQIPGLAYRDEGGNVQLNSRRELISDLDALPFPARDLIDNKRYSPPPTKRVSLGPNTLIATGRGCPFNCGFCGAQTVWTRKARTRSAGSVVAEIEECIHKFDIQSFHFTDELFTVNRKRVLEICDLIMKRNLKIAWCCSARAQKLDRELLTRMKEAGCHEISFGIESGNQEMLKKIDKSLDLDEAKKVVRLTKQVGIITHASYILGYIGETEETIRDTIRYAKALNTRVAAFFIASPLPGTPLYKEAQEKGYLRPDATWIDYSPLSNTDPILELPNLPVSVLRRWHRKALRGYYFRLGYIIPRLLAIRHWYEVANLFSGAKMFFRIKN